MRTDMDISEPEGMEQAKAWMQNLINRMNDGAKWGIPRSFAIYEFHLATKVAIRMNDHVDEPTELVLEALGWTVKERKRDAA